MNYQVDDRGWVRPETVELTIDEVKKRGWLYGSMQYIPGWAHAAVQKHRDAYELAMHRQEMEARYATGHWRRDPSSGRMSMAAQQMLERLQIASKVSSNSNTCDVDSN